MSSEEKNPHASGVKDVVALPASTIWPLVLAFGATLCFGSLVMNPGVGIAGAVMVLCALVGWVREIFPHERHEEVPVVAHATIATTVRTEVRRIELSEIQRAYLPVESYPITSGIKGGIAGGIAMIVPALIYGLIAQHSIWYAVNLLGGAGAAYWTNPTTEYIAAFHWSGLLVAAVIHTVVCLLVGLLYGALLPMWPRHPILLGGILAPVLWTGMLHSVLWFINPAFADRIAWGWFAASQLFFGIVAGMVVARTGRIQTRQPLPFALRLGIEASELMSSKKEDKN